MNTEQLNRLEQDTKSKILEVLHKDTFNDSNPEGSWDLIRKFYNIAVLHSLYFSNSNLLDPYEFSDSFDYLKIDIENAIIDFYNDNPELLNERCTLNNNYYPVDLRVFIVDLEAALLSDKRED